MTKLIVDFHNYANAPKMNVCMYVHIETQTLTSTAAITMPISFTCFGVSYDMLITHLLCVMIYMLSSICM